MHGAPSIRDELALARLAIDLEAGATGGPPSADEQILFMRASAAPPSDPALIAATRAEMVAGGDPLGDALASLRAPATRRARGQYWTPSAIVEPMVKWALAAGPTRFVDPGCGSGRFTTSALRHDPDIEVVAIDRDPLACLLTRAALSVRGAQAARVLCADYLTADLPEHRGRTAWVGNPPYVRHHHLSSGTKAWAAQVGRSMGLRVSGLAGLHALFFLATALHARAGDVGSFVTSAEWLDVGYGAILRGLLLDGLGGRSLELVDQRAVPFDDAMTTALVTSFEVERPPVDVSIRLVERPEDLSALGEGKLVPATTLRQRQRWSPLFRTPLVPIVVEAETRALGDIARVHRGLVTGSNEFFLMTRAQAAARGLTEVVRPAITAASEILASDGVIHDGPGRRMLLDLPGELDRSAHPAVDAYLSEGEQLGLHERYVTSHRRPWWRVGPIRPAPIVATYMARQAPRFARNPDGLALINIGHGIFPKDELTDDELDELVAALNEGRSAFSGAGRTYHGGLEKFEPGEMESLSIGSHLGRRHATVS